MVQNTYHLRRMYLLCLTCSWLLAQPLNAQIRELPSNEESGVVINRFIGHPFLSHPKVTHEAMVKRSILTHGDPQKPGEPGAVLEYRKDLAVATLWAGNTTPLVEVPDEQVFYIQSGIGRLDNGSDYWDLREGIAMLVPPTTKHRLANTGDVPLEMVILTWQNPEGVTPRKEILVRDVDAIPIRDKNSHWSYLSKNIFNPADGLHPGESVYISYLPPMTITGPHSHPAHHEEVWLKLPPDDTFLLLGSEVREMAPYTAFLVPPNGVTTHSLVNVSRDKRQGWFVFNRFAQGTYPSQKLPSVTSKPLKITANR